MKQILIVDDDHLVRGILEDMVTANGYRAWTAANAREADQVLKRLEVDVILLDIHMPGMRGHKYLEVLRNRGDQTPVLIVSARVHAETARQLIGSGVNGIIMKPFKVERVLKEIDNAISQQ